jgi:hypothetical protein
MDWLQSEVTQTIIRRLLTTLATLLVTHGAMKDNQSGQFVEILSGVVLWVVTGIVTYLKSRQHQAANAVLAVAPGIPTAAAAPTNVLGMQKTPNGLPMVVGWLIIGFASGTLALPTEVRAQTNTVQTTGLVTVVAGDVTGDVLTWVAQHGSAGAEFCGPMIAGKNGGTGPAPTQTAWFLEVPWTSKGATNIDTRIGVMHADVVTTAVTEDQLGLELDEDFLNQNLATATATWPVVNVITKAVAKLDIDLTVSVAHNTGALATGRISDTRMDWGVGAKVVKLF